jgi:hypothetical protein
VRRDRVHSGPFVVVGAHGDRLVEAWSSQRLPFEPSGWLVDLRAQLRVAVSRLTPGPDQVLQAAYSSRSTDRVDVENVLFYNVGPASFARAMRNGVRFERSFHLPVPPSDVGVMVADPAHQHRYALADRGAVFDHWRLARLLASFQARARPMLQGEVRVGTVWWQVRSGRIEVVSRPVAAPDRFAVRLQLEGPDGPRSRLHNLLKVLLDGVVAAFHVHDGSRLSELAARHTTVAPGGSPAAVVDRLMDPSWAVLGPRRLVAPYRTGVQWNPADDGLVAAEVLLRPGAVVRLTGELWTVNEP